MSTLEHAIEIAAKAHSGQVDKAGKPYILHPLRVMMAVITPEQQITAILHDVVEDTPITFKKLKEEGFAPEIIEAVKALTKNKGESRIEAAKRTVLNPIARVVKIADVKDNMNVDRLPYITEKDVNRLEEYVNVLGVLRQKEEIS